jgi:hypothetical protein
MIRLSRSVAVWLAAILLVSAAHAQQAAPAPANPPSPAQLALARELIDLMGLSKLADPIMPAFGNQIRQRSVTRPELTKDLEQVLQSLGPELDQQKQLLLETAPRLYASAFTEAELKEIIAFYKTPAGQKYFQATPTILDEVDAETRRWAERVSEYVMTRVRAEMAKRGHQM